MDAFWKWLMHLNARRVCIISLIIFIGVIGWRAWIELPDREKRENHAKEFTPREYSPLPILAFVEEQSDPANAIVPVCPFRPPAELMPTNQVVTGDVTVTIHDDPLGTVPNNGNSGELVTAGGDQGDEFSWGETDTQGNKWQNRPSRPINVYYRGRMQRPDGSTVAYMSDSRRRQSRFVGIGGKLFGATIIGVDKQKLALQLPDGTRTELATDEHVTITPRRRK